MTGLISSAKSLYLDASKPWHRFGLTGSFFALLLLLGFPASIWSQQASSNLAPETTLPDAPQPQLEVQLEAQPQSLSQSLSQSQSPPANHPTPGNGSIHGVVVDHDGAVYQGVHVSLTQPAPASDPLKTTTSDGNGRFQFADISPGAFRLTISSEGFETQVISGVLQSGETYEVPAIVLPFATATSEVHVTASRIEVAQEQLHEEEQQRVFGVIPNFYVVYAPNAPPLTSHQKFNLAWRSSIDPVTFVVTGAFAGIEQAENGLRGYGQGTEGYAKRYAANYADNFIGTMIGSAILPSLLKQDPRYFYKGTGTTRSRILYALANSVVCKGDNGHWQVNYSGIVGSLAAGGISNLYYPASDRDGVSLTFEDALISIAGSAAQNLFQEFLVRRLTPKIPSYQSSKP
jgi:carboxypeptidase family protein